MRRSQWLLVLACIFGLIFLNQCSDNPFSDDRVDEINKRYGKADKGGGGTGDVTDESDEDSDQPDWAKGNKDENPHIRGNDESGTKRGGDYGDLYILWRDENGAPILNADGLVQPIAFVSLGETLEGDYLIALDDEGFPMPAYDPGDDGWLLTYNAEGDLIIPDGVAPATVDFGRINIVRSPKHVLAQALGEALKALKGVELDIDFCGRLIGEIDGLPKTIDSPRENMAIYKELMTTGYLEGVDLQTLLNKYCLDVLDIAASCFAAGSDKTGIILLDEIVYCNTFLGINEKDNLGNVISYYDFTGYTYDRTRFDYRKIRMVVLPDDPEPWDPDRPLITINQAAFDEHFSFNAYWGEALEWSGTGLAAFNTATDDAVQVLEFIHGDSNIEFHGNDPCN